MRGGSPAAVEYEVREPNRGGSGGGGGCQGVGRGVCMGVMDDGDSEPWIGMAISFGEDAEESLETGCCGEGECGGSLPGVNGVCGEIGM